jgi:hypothetical protein
MMAEDAGPAGDNDTAELLARLEAARADIERLETEAANASGEAASLRTALDDANARIGLAALDADRLRGQIEEASQREQQAAARYRELMLRAEPALPSDMIAGDSIDAIDAAVIAARDVVGRVRSHIEAQATAVRVPVGAPQRAVPDITAMTPQQKIRHGLEQRSNG